MVMPDADAPGTPRRSFPARLKGAFLLDPAVFEEVEHDPGAMAQAALVVGLGGLARGVGGFYREGLVGLIAVLLGGFVMWVVAAAVVWLIGVKSFGGESDFRELLRTLGFASAPLLFLTLGAIPPDELRLLVSLAAHGLAVFAFVVAVRQALDVNTARALWVCTLAFALGLVLMSLLAILFLAPAASEAR